MVAVSGGSQCSRVGGTNCSSVAEVSVAVLVELIVAVSGGRQYGCVRTHPEGPAVQ